jgi:hypothetical protein
MRELAILLLSQANREGGDALPAAQVLERLDTVLWRVAGQAGSRSLISRALSLARSESPTLVDVNIPAAGPFTVAGWKHPRSDRFHAQSDQVILVVHVLELLQTFIGERLTFQLVKEAWPDFDQSSDVVPQLHAP